MSSTNRFLWILLIPAALAALALERPWQGNATEQTRARSLPLFPLLAEESVLVQRVRLQSGTKECNLVLRGEHFLVEERFGHPADALRLQNLIQSLRGLHAGDTVSAGGRHDFTYGLEEGAGTLVQVFGPNNQILADLQCGALRQGRDSNTSTISLEFYVRAKGSSQVHLAAGFHPPVVQPDSWIERHLFPFAPEALQAAQRLDFQGEESWTLENLTGGPAQAWIRHFLQLRMVSVVGFQAANPQPDSPFGFTTDAFRVTLRGGSSVELHLGGLDERGGRYARIPGKPWIFSLAEADAASLRRSRSVFGP